MRYLGLDLGSRRLGIAISDPSGMIATPYKTISHKEEYRRLVKEIEEIVTLEKIDVIVLGLPKNMNNTVGYKGELSISFQKKLEDRLKIPIYLQDERLSTCEAEAVLISNHTRRDQRKKVIDSLAATIILQSYLDKEKK